jgi:hypothetical protein
MHEDLRNGRPEFDDYLAVSAFERTTESRQGPLLEQPRGIFEIESSRGLSMLTSRRGQTTMTTTIDRAEINRRNSTRSTGPRTPEGKARSRFNAVKHGMSATPPVLPGEDPDAFRRRREAWAEALSPRRRRRAVPGRAGGDGLVEDRAG